MTVDQAGVQLDMRRVVAAPIDKVFAAFTQPALMKQWMSPGDIRNGRIDADPRPGGAYAIEMLLPDGKTMNVGGKYVEVVANKKLVYTWKWTHEDEESRVTIELASVPGGTEVRLLHDRFAAAERRDSHEKGWIGCLDKLERLAA